MPGVLSPHAKETGLVHRGLASLGRGLPAGRQVREAFPAVSHLPGSLGHHLRALPCPTGLADHRTAGAEQ